MCINIWRRYVYAFTVNDRPTKARATNTYNHNNKLNQIQIHSNKIPHLYIQHFIKNYKKYITGGNELMNEWQKKKRKYYRQQQQQQQ